MTTAQMNHFTTNSHEAELDRQIEDIIVRLVNGKASDSDRYKYEVLGKRRSKMMKPAALRRLDEYVRLKRVKLRQKTTSQVSFR